MHRHDVAVATITYVRSEEEERLLRRSLGLLAAAGLPVAVADRGVSPGFAEFLRTLPGFSVAVPHEQGLVPQVKAALTLAAAFGARSILYVEADKELFFGNPLNAFLARAGEDADGGVVLASRSDESFRTFPPMQRYTEGVINHLCAELIGAVGDYSYGPFLMPRALLPQLTDIDERLGWGWRHFAFITARRQGFRVLHAVGDYPCPDDQRGEDDAERVHRLRQLSQNILGLIA